MLIFSDFGIEIHFRDGSYFLRFDAGEIVTKMVEVEITKEEMLIAKKGRTNLYNLLLSLEARPKKVIC